MPNVEIREYTYKKGQQIPIQDLLDIGNYLIPNRLWEYAGKKDDLAEFQSNVQIKIFILEDANPIENESYVG